MSDSNIWTCANPTCYSRVRSLLHQYPLCYDLLTRGPDLCTSSSSILTEYPRALRPRLLALTLVALKSDVCWTIFTHLFIDLWPRHGFSSYWFSFPLKCLSCIFDSLLLPRYCLAKREDMVSLTEDLFHIPSKSKLPWSPYLIMLSPVSGNSSRVDLNTSPPYSFFWIVILHISLRRWSN